MLKLIYPIAITVLALAGYWLYLGVLVIMAAVPGARGQ